VTLRIAIIVEGKTEGALAPALQNFLKERLAGRMPKLRFFPEDGRLPTGEKLKGDVERHLKNNFVAVIALTDVYTGSRPPEFTNAGDAKEKMKRWVGQNPKFHPHAAQYEFEAWLLPYWSRIQDRSGNRRPPWSQNPESVDHDCPPAKRLKKLVRSGSNKRSYVKTRDAKAILEGQDLALSAAQCPELKAFQNTLLSLAGGATI